MESSYMYEFDEDSNVKNDEPNGKNVNYRLNDDTSKQNLKPIFRNSIKTNNKLNKQQKFSSYGSNIQNNNFDKDFESKNSEIKSFYRDLATPKLNQNKFDNIKNTFILTNHKESTGNNDVTYERLNISWYELAFPITLLTFTLLGLLIICIILILWIKQSTFSRRRQQHTFLSDDNDRYHIKTKEDKIRIIDDADTMINSFGQNLVSCEADTSSNNPYHHSPPTSPTIHYPQQQADAAGVAGNATALELNTQSPIYANTVPIPCAISVPVTPFSCHNISVSSTDTITTTSATESCQPRRITAIIKRPHAPPKITQKDLTTPPIPISKSAKRFSFIHHNVSTSQQSMGTVPQSSVPPQSPLATNEWILHDSTAMSLSQQPGDICCVQPPIIKSSPLQSPLPPPPPTPASLVATPTLLFLGSNTPGATTVPSSPLIQNYYHTKQSNWSPKILSDDKENFVPPTQQQHGSGANSPKLQQRYSNNSGKNSPRLFDYATANRFSFSPKLLHHMDEHYSGAHNVSSAGIITSVGVLTTSGASPFMTSAGYKHGNYFRFPEVDVFSPAVDAITGKKTNSSTSSVITVTSTTTESAANTSTSDAKSQNDENTTNDGNLLRIHSDEFSNLKLTTTTSLTKSSASRRARLKSISLDSDGARLVEENLGIPVEELVEIASLPDVYNNNNDDNENLNNQNYNNNNENSNMDRRSSSGSSSTTNTTTNTNINVSSNNNYNDQESTSSGSSSRKSSSNEVPHEVVVSLPPPNNEDDACCSNTEQKTLEPLGIKFNPKNKNHLSINLNVTDDSLQIKNDYDYKMYSGGGNMPTTPKTPTLSQTRQKAISLDSDPQCSFDNQSIAHPTVGTCCSTSANNSIFNVSISVPSTPKRKPLTLSAITIDDDVDDVNDDAAAAAIRRENPALLAKLSKKNSLHRHSSHKPQQQQQYQTGVYTKQPLHHYSHQPHYQNTHHHHHLSKHHQQQHPHMEQFHQKLSSSDRFGGSCGSNNTASNNSFGYLRKLGSFHEKMDFCSAVSDMKNSQSGDHIATASKLQTIKASAALCASNNNLKTLPEVVTLSDFSGGKKDSTINSISDNLENLRITCKAQQKFAEAALPPQLPIMQSSSATSVLPHLNKSRSSILQRRGSNHSLTLNVEGHGSVSNLHHHGLSASNYSLGNLKGSHCSLSGSTFNFENTNPIITPNTVMRQKPNLLQRRGSNTSLTLNIQGSNHSLNRFSSHSSLNISQDGASSHVGHTVGGQGIGLRQKKGLLERRNSNASLTLNIQNRGLSISNYNLRGSECSLNSNTEAAYDEQLQQAQPELQQHQQQQQPQPNQQLHQHYHYHYHNRHRKFLSSENLHNFSTCPDGTINNTTATGTLMTKSQYAHPSHGHLYQNHHSSASDLKQHTGTDHGGYCQDPSCESCLAQTNECGNGTNQYCDCGIRNISTKPLSPQTTSEDFKIYLANIQMLQNASNILNEQKLKNLNHIFQRSYAQKTMSDSEAITTQKEEVLKQNENEGKHKPISHEDYQNIIDGDDTTIIINNDVEVETVGEDGTGDDVDILDNTSVDKIKDGDLRHDDDRVVVTNENSDVEEDEEDEEDDQECDEDEDDDDDDDDGNDDDEILSIDAQKSLLRNLHQEFWDLPTNYQEKPLVFGSQAKNRYKTILPNEHSRVILQAESGQLQEPYINANYIKGPDYAHNSYIATQGPLPNTIYEFWLMVYQNSSTSNQSKMQRTRYESKMCNQRSSQKIAMLTDIVENSRQKCAAYFPKEQNDFMIFSSTTNETDNKIIEPFAERLFNNQITNDTIDTEDDDYDGENHDTDDNDEFPQINCNYFLIKNMEIIVKNGYTIRKFCLVYINSSSNSDCSSSSTSGNCTSSGSAASGSSSSSIRRHKINFKVTDVVNIKRMYVYHYWFPDWPDHRSPSDIDVLLDMSLDLLDGQPNSSEYPEQQGNNDENQDGAAVAQQPKDVSDADNKSFEPLPIIHCSAGIGRTGCLAAILNGLRQMRASSNHTENNAVRSQISVDILGIVCNLRLQRGGMVQNSEQYELIHRALCLYQQRLNSN